MLKKSIFLDAILFVAIVLILLIVIPAISSILKKLVLLQIIIVIAGAIGLRYLVQKIKRKIKW